MTNCINTYIIKVNFYTYQNIYIIIFKLNWYGCVNFDKNSKIKLSMKLGGKNGKLIESYFTKKAKW